MKSLKLIISIVISGIRFYKIFIQNILLNRNIIYYINKENSYEIIIELRRKKKISINCPRILSNQIIYSKIYVLFVQEMKREFLSSIVYLFF